MKVNDFLTKCRNNQGFIILHDGYDAVMGIYGMDDRDFENWDGWLVGGWQIGINEMMVPEIHIYACKEGC